jgi:hypothetical protein
VLERRQINSKAPVKRRTYLGPKEIEDPLHSGGHPVSSPHLEELDLISSRTISAPMLNLLAEVGLHLASPLAQTPLEGVKLLETQQLLASKTLSLADQAVKVRHYNLRHRVTRLALVTAPAALASATDVALGAAGRDGLGATKANVAYQLELGHEAARDGRGLYTLLATAKHQRNAEFLPLGLAS